MWEMSAFPNSFPSVKQIKKKIKWEKEHFHTAGKGFWGVLNGKCQNRKCNCFSFPFLFILIQDEIFHFDYLHHRMKSLCQNCHFHMKKFQVLKISFFPVRNPVDWGSWTSWTATNSCPWVTWGSRGGSAGHPRQLCSSTGAASQTRFSLSPMGWRDQLALGGCQAMSGGNVALQRFEGGCRQGKRNGAREDMWPQGVSFIRPSQRQWASKAWYARYAIPPASRKHLIWWKRSLFEESLKAVDQKVSHRLVFLKCQALCWRFWVWRFHMFQPQSSQGWRTNLWVPPSLPLSLACLHPRGQQGCLLLTML